MRYAFRLLTSAFIAGNLIGSAGNLPHAVATDKNVKTSYGTAAYSSYQKVEKFEKSMSKNQISWKKDSIAVTVNRVQVEGAIPSEKNVISTITVTTKNKKIEIPTNDFKDKFHDISSVSPSSTSAWLAIQMQRSSGNSLLLVNAQTGKSVMINDRLLSEGKKNIETVSAYNWSPTEDNLAFSFGNPEKSSIAVYDTKEDSITFLPRTTNYISTIVILWNKNGTRFDYISEYPSDKWILYRYFSASNKVKPIQKVDNQTLQKWTERDK